MSVAKEAHAAKQSSKTKKSAGRYSGTATKRRTSQSIGWDECDAVAIAALVAAVTNAGDAVLFSRTSDGGALSLTIMTDGDKHREYFTDPELATVGLRELTILAAS